jgi:hypothetical protein
MAAVTPVLWWLLQPRVELRTWAEYRDGRVIKGADVREWTLDIPRRFPLLRYRVYTRPVFDPTSPEKNHQYITLRTASLDPSDTIVPGRDKGRNRQFTISLNNRLLRQKDLSGEDYCLKGDDIYVLDDEGNRSPSAARCASDSPACHVYLNYHGWNAAVAVATDGLYREPDKVCAIARKFLDRWTSSIDDLREPHRLGVNEIRTQRD